MLGRVLRLEHYEIAPFASGEEFLASLVNRTPACAILDVHLPQLSGIEVQSRLRAAQLAVPVIFITASDDPALDAIILEARGTTLLRKPFSSDELLIAIRSALRSAAADA